MKSLLLVVCILSVSSHAFVNTSEFKTQRALRYYEFARLQTMKEKENKEDQDQDIIYSFKLSASPISFSKIDKEKNASVGLSFDFITRESEFESEFTYDYFSSTDPLLCICNLFSTICFLIGFMCVVIIKSSSSYGVYI